MGPGKPVMGDGVLGGGASDVGGGHITEENRAELATGEVVKSGLLPRIKPVWDQRIFFMTMLNSPALVSEKQ